MREIFVVRILLKKAINQTVFINFILEENMLVIIILIYVVLGGTSLVLILLHKHRILGFKITNKTIGAVIAVVFLVCFILFGIDYLFDFFIWTNL